MLSTTSAPSSACTLHPCAWQHLPSPSPSSWLCFGSPGEAGEPTTPHLPHAHPTPPTSRPHLSSSCSTHAGCYPHCPDPCPLCLALGQQGFHWVSKVPMGWAAVLGVSAALREFGMSVGG